MPNTVCYVCVCGFTVDAPSVSCKFSFLNESSQGSFYSTISETVGKDMLVCVCVCVCVCVHVTVLAIVDEHYSCMTFL